MEECPMAEHLQLQLNEFHQQMINKIRHSGGEGQTEASEENPDILIKTEDEGWVDKLAGFVVRVPPPRAFTDEKSGLRGEGKKFFQFFIQNKCKI